MTQDQSVATDLPRRKSRMPQKQRVSMILSVARRMLAERDYNAVSVAEIAAECGIVEGTIYRFFKSKRDLMLRVAEDWMEQEYRIGAAYAHVTGTRERIYYLIHSALRTTYDFPGLSRFLLTEVRPDPNYRKMRIYKLNRTYTSAIREVCQEAIASGEFHDRISTRLIRSVVFGAMEHETWGHLRGEGRIVVTDVARELTDLIYEGMRNRNAPPEGTLPLPERVERIEARLARLEAALTRDHDQKI